MRLFLTTTLVLLGTSAAIAQPAPAPFGATITREQFVQHAAEAAGRRFEAIDVNRTGTITRAQLRAWRQAHRGQAGEPQ